MTDLNEMSNGDLENLQKMAIGRIFRMIHGLAACSNETYSDCERIIRATNDILSKRGA